MPFRRLYSILQLVWLDELAVLAKVQVIVDVLKFLEALVCIYRFLVVVDHVSNA